MNITRIGSFILLATCLLGAEIQVDSPQKITPEWETKILGIKYNAATLDNAVKEMTEGLIDDTFDKAFIARIKDAIKKHPTGTGEYVEYWNCGRIKARLPYKDGKPNGHLHGWYLNGNDAFKGYFQEGLKQGTHITFFCSKDLRSSGEARILRFNEEGRLNGKQRLWHRTNWLWLAIYYKDGKACGALEAWDDKGTYLLGAQYKKNILQKKPPPPPGKRSYPSYTIEEKYVGEVTREFKKIGAKEFGLSPYATGASMPFDVERISVDFQICKKGSVEQSRDLIVKLTERFTQVINKHEKLRPYLREYPFKPNRINITIIYCDQFSRRNTDGSICRASVGATNKIYYRTEKPNKNSEIYLIEPYDDAVKIVHAKKE